MTPELLLGIMRFSSPDDVVVATVNRPITPAQAEELKAQLQPYVGEHKIMVVPEAIDLYVLAQAVVENLAIRVSANLPTSRPNG